MLPKSLLNLLGLITNYCYYTLVIPFYYSYQINRMILTKSKFRLYSCVTVYMLNLIHVLMALEKLVLIMSRKLPYDPMIVFLLFELIIAISIPLTIAGGVIILLEDFICCINQYFGYYERFEGSIMYKILFTCSFCTYKLCFSNYSPVCNKRSFGA